MRKIISFFVLFLFSIQIIFSNSNIDQINIINTFKFEIDKRIGAVTDIYSIKNGKTNPLYIIEDLHCNVECQKKTFQILELIKEKHNKIDFIGIEGNSGLVPTGLLNNMSFKKDALVQHLLSNGFLTGAELFNLKNNTKIIGLEDKNVYLENFKSLYRGLNNRAKINRILDKVDRDINKLKRIFLNTNKELQEIVNLRESYDKGKISLSLYIFELLEKLDSNADLAKYQNIKRFIEYNDLRDDLDMSQVNLDAIIVVKKINDRLDNKEIQALKQGDYYSVLEQILLARRIRYSSQFKELAVYFKLRNLEKQTNFVNLIAEKNMLEQQVIEYRIKSKDVKDLMYMETYLGLLKKYISNELGPIEIEQYEKGYTRFEEIIKDLGSRISISNHILENKDYIQKVYQNMQDFYKLANKRNEILVSNLINPIKINIANNCDIRRRATDPSLQQRVLIIGGYHTKGVTQILRTKGIPFIVIRPTITKKHDKNIYLQRLKSQAEYLKISPQINSLVSPVLASFLGLITGDLTRVKESMRFLEENLNPEKFIELLISVSKANIETKNLEFIRRKLSRLKPQKEINSSNPSSYKIMQPVTYGKKRKKYEEQNYGSNVPPPGLFLKVEGLDELLEEIKNKAITLERFRELLILMLASTKKRVDELIDEQGNTLMHYVCQYGRLDLYSELSNIFLADFKVRNYKGETPFKFACHAFNAYFSGDKVSSANSFREIIEKLGRELGFNSDDEKGKDFFLLELDQEDINRQYVFSIIKGGWKTNRSGSSEEEIWNYFIRTRNKFLGRGNIDKNKKYEMIGLYSRMNEELEEENRKKKEEEAIRNKEVLEKYQKLTENIREIESWYKSKEEEIRGSEDLDKARQQKRLYELFMRRKKYALFERDKLICMVRPKKKQEEETEGEDNDIDTSIYTKGYDNTFEPISYRDLINDDDQGLIRDNKRVVLGVLVEEFVSVKKIVDYRMKLHICDADFMFPTYDRDKNALNIPKKLWIHLVHRYTAESSKGKEKARENKKELSTFLNSLFKRTILSQKFNLDVNELNKMPSQVECMNWINEFQIKHFLMLIVEKYFQTNEKDPTFLDSREDRKIEVLEEELKYEIERYGQKLNNIKGLIQITLKHIKSKRKIERISSEKLQEYRYRFTRRDRSIKEDEKYDILNKVFYENSWKNEKLESFVRRKKYEDLQNYLQNKPKEYDYKNKKANEVTDEDEAIEYVFEAARRNEPEMVRRLLNRHKLFDKRYEIRDEYNRTLLQFACQEGRFRVYKYLRYSEGAILEKDSKGRSLLKLACLSLNDMAFCDDLSRLERSYSVTVIVGSLINKQTDGKLSYPVKFETENDLSLKDEDVDISDEYFRYLSGGEKEYYLNIKEMVAHVRSGRVVNWPEGSEKICMMFRGFFAHNMFGRLMHLGGSIIMFIRIPRLNGLSRKSVGEILSEEKIEEERVRIANIERELEEDRFRIQAKRYEERTLSRTIKDAFKAVRHSDIGALTRILETTEFEIDNIDKKRKTTLLHYICLNGTRMMFRFIMSNYEVGLNIKDLNNHTPFQAVCIELNKRLQEGGNIRHLKAIASEIIRQKRPHHRIIQEQEVFLIDQENVCEEYIELMCRILHSVDGFASSNFLRSEFKKRELYKRQNTEKVLKRAQAVRELFEAVKSYDKEENDNIHEIHALIKEAGIDVNEILYSQDGTTLMHYVCRLAKGKLYEILIKYYDFNREVKDFYGREPLRFVCEEMNENQRKYLEEEETEYGNELTEKYRKLKVIRDDIIRFKGIDKVLEEKDIFLEDQEVVVKREDGNGYIGSMKRSLERAEVHPHGKIDRSKIDRSMRIFEENEKNRKRGVFKRKNERPIIKLLFQAVKQDDLKSLKMYAKEDNVTLKNYEGKTLLQVACERGNIRIVNWLLDEFEFIIDINRGGIIQDYSNENKRICLVPLITAVRRGHKEIARILLSYVGCRLNQCEQYIIKEDDKQKFVNKGTALHVACLLSDVDCVNMLLEHNMSFQVIGAFDHNLDLPITKVFYTLNQEFLKQESDRDLNKIDDLKQIIRFYILMAKDCSFANDFLEWKNFEDFKPYEISTEMAEEYKDFINKEFSVDMKKVKEPLSKRTGSTNRSMQRRVVRVKAIMDNTNWYETEVTNDKEVNLAEHKNMMLLALALNNSALYEFVSFRLKITVSRINEIIRFVKEKLKKEQIQIDKYKKQEDEGIIKRMGIMKYKKAQNNMKLWKDLDLQLYSIQSFQTVETGNLIGEEDFFRLVNKVYGLPMAKENLAGYVLSLANVNIDGLLSGSDDETVVVIKLVQQVLEEYKNISSRFALNFEIKILNIVNAFINEKRNIYTLIFTSGLWTDLVNEYRVLSRSHNEKSAKVGVIEIIKAIIKHEILENIFKIPHEDIMKMPSQTRVVEFLKRHKAREVSQVIKVKRETNIAYALLDLLFEKEVDISQFFDLFKNFAEQNGYNILKQYVQKDFPAATIAETADKLEEFKQLDPLLIQKAFEKIALDTEENKFVLEQILDRRKLLMIRNIINEDQEEFVTWKNEILPLLKVLQNLRVSEGIFDSIDEYQNTLKEIKIILDKLVDYYMNYLKGQGVNVEVYSIISEEIEQSMWDVFSGLKYFKSKCYKRCGNDKARPIRTFNKKIDFIHIKQLLYIDGRVETIKDGKSKISSVILSFSDQDQASSKAQVQMGRKELIQGIMDNEKIIYAVEKLMGIVNSKRNLSNKYFNKEAFKQVKEAV